MTTTTTTTASTTAGSQQPHHHGRSSEMSALMNQARSRVPRIAEAAVERARLTVVPRAARAARPGCPFVALVSLLLVGGVAGLLVLQHLDAAGVLHRDRAGAAGVRARGAASSR